MGVDYYAYAVIGCEVTGKLYDEAKMEVRQCDCPSGGTPATFCAYCGRRIATVTRVKRTPKPFYEEENDRLLLPGGGHLTVRTTEDNKQAFAGIATNAVDTCGDSSTRIAFEPGSFSLAYDAVRAGLESLGLWDPATFGVWAVMCCSY